MADRKKLDGIVVHATATGNDWMANANVNEKRDEIRRWHIQERGWKDIGYAAIIDRDGTIAWGRDLDKDGDTFDDIGAHVKGQNSISVGVALVGGKTSSATDKFSDNFTEKQDAALRRVITLIKEYAVKRGFQKNEDDVWVKGHNEFAAKACPGFQVGPWYANKTPRTQMASKTLISAGSGAVATVGATAQGISALDGTAQLVFIGMMFIVLVALYVIFRERIKKWARGIR